MPELIDTTDAASQLPTGTIIRIPPPDGLTHEIRATRVDGGWEVAGMNFVMSHDTLFSYGAQWEIVSRPDPVWKKAARTANTARKVRPYDRTLRRISIAVAVVVAITIAVAAGTDDDDDDVDDDGPGTSWFVEQEDDD